MVNEERLEEVKRNTFAYAHKLREIGLESDVTFLLQTIEVLQKQQGKFQVKDKETGKINTVYEIREYLGKTQFLVYNAENVGFTWESSKYFEPI